VASLTIQESSSYPAPPRDALDAGDVFP